MTATAPIWAQVHTVAADGTTTFSDDVVFAGTTTESGATATAFTTTASGSGNVSGIQSVLTVTPGAAYTGQRQAYWGLLDLTGSGASHNSVQIATAEFWTRNHTTGGLTSTFYAAEATIDNLSADSVTAGYALQGNWRNLGGGNVTTAVCVRGVFNPGAAGTVNVLHIFQAAMDTSAGTAPILTLNGITINTLTNSGGGTDTTGGYAARGGLFAIPTQGGNTSGTNINDGLRVTGGGGGAPGNGGQMQNSALKVDVPNPVGNASSAGHQNYGIQITGNGSAAVAGLLNYALFSSSTAASLLTGPLSVGTSTAFQSTSATTMIVAANGTHSSGTSQLWDGVKVSGTLTLTGTTHITSATGVNMVSLYAPTITDSSAVIVDQGATLAILGPPAQSGSVTLTYPYSFWVQAGLSRFDGSVLQNHVTTAAINSTATATAAQVLTGYITSTSAAPTTITLPTGTLLGAALNASQGTIFDLTIDNTAGANTVTVAVATNGILSALAAANAGESGLLTIPSGVTGQGQFRLMFSSATAYTFSRIA